MLDHHLDHVVGYTDGHIVAYSVKPEEDASKHVEEMKVIFGGREKDFAHDFRLLTEKHLDKVTLSNANEIVRCGLHFDGSACEIVQAHLQEADRIVTPRGVACATKLGERGANALIALLQTGLVVLHDKYREISLDTQIDNCVVRSN